MKKRIVIFAVIFVLACGVYFIRTTSSNAIIIEKEGSLQNDLPEETRESDIPVTLSGDSENEILYCHIDGAVNHPGVYELSKGSHVFELVELAGGLTSNADAVTLNQAATLLDGIKIYIPTKAEKTVVKIIGPDEMPLSSSAISTEASSDQTQDTKRVNINTATSEQLQSLSGVGPSTAAKIIAYRNKAGKFHKPEDLMNVSGIGQKTFEKLEDYIVVD